jgi:hypothetical protein
MMSDPTDRLALAGDALVHAWHNDLAGRVEPKRSRRPRTVVAVLVAALVVSAGVAVAANTLLKSPKDEQAGMVEANTLFQGSNPTCLTVSPDSFHCTLDRPPTGETFYSQDGKPLLNAFLGMKEPTVDSTNHIDGGCVSDHADGLSWQCYLGPAAVSHEIVSADFLGKLSPGPAAG